ncbi:hypothetical protein CH259_16700 [Rhodococcus sp. 05-2254-4]|nr:hypothetical protein CH259_16700 [Rhodococcus sp. 05-2254-4]OZE48092.1 hypothetical protein CH261_09295 [Rhodococcus sp. 05-2254-3]OZE49303.1 hypothetical protein CH283_17080 [Rhodococcus sp. 05-2254-2]
MSEYTFSYSQLFNVFGAPGIPNTYEARLYRDGRCIKSRTFWWRSKAESQCMKWRALYGAVPR